MLEQPKIIGEAPSPRALIGESARALDRASVGESVGESARASARASAPAFSRASAYAGERTSWLSRLWNHVPQDCLLCAGPARGQPVCVGCLGDVPVLPAVRCRVCALPLGALPGTAANLHVPEPPMGTAAKRCCQCARAQRAHMWAMPVASTTLRRNLCRNYLRATGRRDGAAT
jgi:hypothetical protein